MQPTLADRLDALLPQTQCTKCGYPGCRPYAEAIADGRAAINQCPPGGKAGIEKLSALLGRPVIALNPANGCEAPLKVAVIDEASCIGCTLCIQACPVDAIVGAAGKMHTVLAGNCSGCDLCVLPCPMDCIRMIDAQREWTATDGRAARRRHDARAHRLHTERRRIDQQREARTLAKRDPTTADGERKTAAIEAAIARARARRAAQKTGPAGR